jgi:hypothetical protein
MEIGYFAVGIGSTVNPEPVRAIATTAGYAPVLHSYETQGKSFANISAELRGHGHDEVLSLFRVGRQGRCDAARDLSVPL